MLSNDAESIRDRLEWLNDDMENLDVDYLVKLAADFEDEEDEEPVTPKVEKSTLNESISTIKSVFTTMIIFGFFFALCSGGVCALVINKRCLKPVQMAHAPRTESATIDMQVIGKTEEKAASGSNSGSNKNKKQQHMPV